MLTLVTSNPAKYAPFQGTLDRYQVVLEAPGEALPEVQSLDFRETLTAKARAAAARFGRPVLVDDTGLVLGAYPQFPGPLTATVLRSLGVEGLRRLLKGTSDRAVMECHLGCWVDGELRHWQGRVPGRLDLARTPRNPRMLLSDLFLPDETPGTVDQAGELEGGARLRHREEALAALGTDIFGLHLALAPKEGMACGGNGLRQSHDCPFCHELAEDGGSIFAGMMAGRLTSRIVYEDEHFIVMPPLGQFMVGGLLVLTRRHVLSLAHLSPELLIHLERLVGAIRRVLWERWGVSPLVFEHGPAPEWSKGVCCVDHAHLNIFPAAVPVHPSLAARMHLPIQSLTELERLRSAEFGYLFVQENDGARRIYDGRDVPTQLVRRVITTQLGMPERWHWRDYPGREELLATYAALKDQIRL